METGSRAREHRGYWFYTIGQRTGLGLAGGPWYVVKKDVDQNAFSYRTRTPRRARATGFIVRELTWTWRPPEKDRLLLKIRHGPQLIERIAVSGRRGNRGDHGSPDRGVAPGPVRRLLRRRGLSRVRQDSTKEESCASLFEDDPKIGQFVARGLREAGFAVDHVERAEDAVPAARGAGTTMRRSSTSCFPEWTDLTMIEKLRGAGVATPMLVLSAKRSVEDRVQGFTSGGDDYLTKPFSFSELLVRVQALIRRSTRAAAPTRLSVGDLDSRSALATSARGERDRPAAPRVLAARVPRCATPVACSPRR